MEELEYTYILAYREIYLDIGDASDNLKSIANTYKIRWSDELNSYYSQYSSNREIVASIKSYLRYDLDTAESDLEQINDFYDEFQFPPLNLVNSDLLFNIDQAIKAVLDSYEDYYDFLEYPYNATRWNELFPEDGYREFINTNTTKYSAYMGSVVELGNLILKTYDLYK